METHEGLNVWRDWFRENPKRTKSVEPAREVLESSRAFIDNVSQLVPMEAKLSATVHSKQDALRLSEYETASAELGSAQAKNLVWSARRKKGLRKLPALLQTFMTRFADFLEAYSGIVEIVKQADSQYGGLAYSSLSLLLLVGTDAVSAELPLLSSKVAVNKSKREDQIESTLESLRWEIPRISKLQRLIPDDNSALLVSKVYSNVVKFARSCVMYYSRNSIKRVFSNIIKPPKLSIDKDVAEIRGDIAEIFKEVEVKTHQRIHSLEARQQENRDIQVKERIWDLQKALRSKPQTAEDLTRYRNAMLDPSTQSKKYEQLSLPTLQEKPEFQAWYNSDVSGLFLLYGTTLNARSGFSWLSPAALHLVQALRDGALDDETQHTRRTLVLCALAHDTAWSPSQAQTASYTLISQLLLSALEHHTSYILDAAKFSHLKTSIDDDDNPLFKNAVPRLPCRFLAEILEYDDSPLLTTFVVLDRIDACKCGTSTFLETLFRELVVKCKATVKVFAVVGGLGDFEIRDVTAVADGEKRFRAVRLDQRVSKRGAR